MKPLHAWSAVLGPLLCGALGFALREGLRPAPLPPPGPGRAVPLPTPSLVPFRAKAERFQLQPELSAARFLVRGDLGELQLRCPGLSGTLQFDPEPGRSSLELRLDLHTLDTVDDTPLPAEALRHLLGVHRSATATFRGTWTHTLSTPVPGLVQLLFDGTLELGGHVVRQSLGLWRAALPGQPLRLCGHGTVDAHDYGLPERSFLGFRQEQHLVTLGLDLAFRRSGDG